MIIQRQVVYQKEFGIVSGIKKRVAKSLRNSAENDAYIMRSSLGSMGFISIKDPKVEKGLLRGIKNNGGRTLSSPSGNDFIRKGGGAEKLLKEYESDPFVFETANSYRYDTNLRGKGKRLVNKVKNAEDTSTFQVYHSRNNGPAELSHEYNHAKNSISKNPIKRFISKVANSEKTRLRLESDLGENTSGLKNAAKDYILGKIVRAEESSASRGAIKDLKKLGLDKKGVEDSKRLYKYAGNTYKYGQRARLKNILANTLDKE